MLKRDDAFLVRRAIMLHPVMPGEEENIQEIENLAKAVRIIFRRESSYHYLRGWFRGQTRLTLKGIGLQADHALKIRRSERYPRGEVEVGNIVWHAGDQSERVCQGYTSCRRYVESMMPAENHPTQTRATRTHHIGGSLSPHLRDHFRKYIYTPSKYKHMLLCQATGRTHPHHRTAPSVRFSWTT